MITAANFNRIRALLGQAAEDDIGRECCTAQALCERLATELGLRVAAIDTVLWRACANGVLNSKTGEILA